MRFPIGKAMPFLNALRTIRAQLSSHAIVLPSCDRPSPHPPTAIALLHTSPKAIAFPHLPNTIAPLLIHQTSITLLQPRLAIALTTFTTCTELRSPFSNTPNAIALHSRPKAIALLSYPHYLRSPFLTYQAFCMAIEPLAFLELNIEQF